MKDQCLLCNRPLNQVLSLKFLMTFQPYRRPVICRKCRSQFKRISREHCCRDCSKAGDFEAAICPDCLRWRRITGERFQNYGLYQYNSMMSEYMHRYKFQGDYRLRQIFKNHFNAFIKGMHRQVVPIPVHRATYQQRGFNQVAGLLGSIKTINILKTKRDRKTVPQSHKRRADRLRLAQPFTLDSTQLELIKDQRLIIVDDVYTTGTTIRHAARLLKRGGAKSVVGVTLAR